MYWSFGSPHLQVNGPSLSTLLAALASSPNTQGDRSLALSLVKTVKMMGTDRQPREEENRKKERLSEKNHTSKSITIHLSKFCLFPSFLPSFFTEQLLLSEIVRERTIFGCSQFYCPVYSRKSAKTTNSLWKWVGQFVGHVVLYRKYCSLGKKRKRRRSWQRTNNASFVRIKNLPYGNVTDLPTLWK